MKTIEAIFEELVQFIEASNDAQILQKIHDITTFLHKSFADLDKVTNEQLSQKRDIYIPEEFKPLTFNVKRALDLVKKFEMSWPDRHGNDTYTKQGVTLHDPKIVNSVSPLTAGERMGVYKS